MLLLYTSICILGPEYIVYVAYFSVLNIVRSSLNMYVLVCVYVYVYVCIYIYIYIHIYIYI